jgi:alkaline phosphatase D
MLDGDWSSDVCSSDLFAIGDALSPVGRTRTLPAADQRVDRLRLAFASCQRLASGHFGAYRRLLDEQVDAVVFLGDYIYDSGAYPSATVPRGIEPALNLKGYRAHYELHKRDPALQAAHAAHPWFLLWDDHEVVNDYAGGPLAGMAPGRAAGQRRAAYQAWYEHMPVRLATLAKGVAGLTQEGAEVRLYGQSAWGRLAMLTRLDCRQYRDAQACSGVGGLIVAEDCAALADPARSMLGAEQEAWLARALARQGPGQGQPWNLLLQSTLFSPRRIPFMGGLRTWNDGWDGYPAARARLIQQLVGQQVAGPVLLGGDLHENWAVNVPAGTGESEADRRCVASEFVGTGITMSSFFPKKIDEIRAANPHAVYADAARTGYGLVDITASRLQVQFRSVDSLANPEPAINTTASFVVEAGNPRVQHA